ncbi:hypothetical protein NDU88_000074 [Pleurodeles waltl]|uniref:Uncharacterized protein n=1 Tax=Pleurodeles waltl TaxID=8319 RepID=A0AAV7S4M3_PLEWA|nr:hypothetical protein NDU88_000074 [Pleurodeles waltl]
MTASVADERRADSPRALARCPRTSALPYRLVAHRSDAAFAKQRRYWQLTPKRLELACRGGGERACLVGTGGESTHRTRERLLQHKQDLSEGAMNVAAENQNQPQ